MSDQVLQAGTGLLVKDTLAARLREAIMDGRLAPGQRVVEGVWAREFGAAQASVREAINLLISLGFLVKDSGRSARVVNYGEADVAHVYQVRGAIEGLAAQLASAARAPLDGMDQALSGMEEAARRGDMHALIEADLRFHTALGEASGNPVLVEIVARLLTPLFAFTLLRVTKSGQGPKAWVADIVRHRRIIEVIRDGNPALARQYTQHSVNRFVAAAYAVWSNETGAVEAHIGSPRAAAVQPGEPSDGA